MFSWRGAFMDGGVQPTRVRAVPQIRPRPRVQRLSKRVFDFAAALAGLVFLSPVLVVIAALVRLQDGGPAIFAHKRIGRDGVTFRCLKFRTMVTDADRRLRSLLMSDSAAAAEWLRDQKLRRDPRVTKLGRFLRKSSLDELPQLINILRGEMSVVGPRPIIAEEIPRYGELFDHYAAVNPGLTGPWQISGRNDVTYDERVALDAQYAAEWTVFGDIRIAFLTVPAVIFASGAS